MNCRSGSGCVCRSFTKNNIIAMKKILFFPSFMIFAGCGGHTVDADKFLFFSGPKEVSAEEQDIVCEPSEDVEFILGGIAYFVYQYTENSRDIVEQETVYFSKEESSYIQDWFSVDVVERKLHVSISKNTTPYYRKVVIDINPKEGGFVPTNYQVTQIPVESSLSE